MTTPTTTRSSTDSCSPLGTSSPKLKRRLSSEDVVVAMAVDLISTSYPTLPRLDLTGANCLKATAPDFLHPKVSNLHEQRLCCESCPIRVECLADALVFENQLLARAWLVRGGVSGSARRALIVKLRKEGVLEVPDAQGRFYRRKPRRSAA